MSCVLLWSFKEDLMADGINATSLLLLLSMFYGLRLAVFIYVRWISVPNMPDQAKGAEKINSIPKILALDAVVPALYVCMVAPLLWLVRSGPIIIGVSRAVSETRLWFGFSMASVGFIIETIADQHKYLAKRWRKSSYGETRFVGPTGGLYRLCRHPNFLGDILFWTGLYSNTLDMHLLRNDTILWICATLGWITILNIMYGSANRLDKKHQKKYQGQPEFDKWQKEVKASLVPLLI